MDRVRRPTRNDRRSGAAHHDGELVTSRKETRRLLSSVQNRLSNRAADRPGAEHARARHFDRRGQSVAGVRSVGVAAGAFQCPRRRAAAIAATVPAASDRPSEGLRDDVPRPRRRPPSAAGRADLGHVAAAVESVAVDDRALAAPTGFPGASQRAHTWRAVGITFAVLGIGAAIAWMVILADESQDSTTSTLVTTNTESSADCPTPGEDDMELGDGRPDPCESIQLAQEHLNTLTGAALEIDGRFGAETEAAVKQFQHENGLNEDGRLGPETWAEIMEQLGGS